MIGVLMNGSGKTTKKEWEEWNLKYNMKLVVCSAPNCSKPTLGQITDHICSVCRDAYIYCPDHAEEYGNMNWDAPEMWQ